MGESQLNKGVRVLHKKCSSDLAHDRSLPYTAYLVTYVEDGETFYDISTCNKQVELFDFYWDTYKSDFKYFNQTEGRVNPRLWSPKKEG
jgi:hypothetical protein